jgi:aconitate hydratase A / 2-methylisocitrate dehydratase
MATNPDSMKTRRTLDVGGVRYALHRLDALGTRAARLPVSLRILLENLLRREDGR